MRLRDLRKDLLEQHAEIRRLVASVEAGLDQRVGSTELNQRLTALREAVQAHNEAEESTLKPILETIDAWGPARVEALVSEHHAEHEGVLAKLEPGAGADGEKLKALLQELVTHLAREEKTLLTEKLLRDDVIQLDAGD